MAPQIDIRRGKITRCKRRRLKPGGCITKKNQKFGSYHSTAATLEWSIPTRGPSKKTSRSIWQLRWHSRLSQPWKVTFCYLTFECRVVDYLTPLALTTFEGINKTLFRCCFNVLTKFCVFFSSSDLWEPHKLVTNTMLRQLQPIEAMVWRKGDSNILRIVWLTPTRINKDLLQPPWFEWNQHFNTTFAGLAGTRVRASVRFIRNGLLRSCGKWTCSSRGSRR